MRKTGNPQKQIPGRAEEPLKRSSFAAAGVRGRPSRRLLMRKTGNPQKQIPGRAEEPLKRSSFAAAGVRGRPSRRLLMRAAGIRSRGSWSREDP